MYGILFPNLSLASSKLSSMISLSLFPPMFILDSLAKIFFPRSYTPQKKKNPVSLVRKFFKKPEYRRPDPRCTERMHINKRRHRP